MGEQDVGGLDPSVPRRAERGAAAVRMPNLGSIDIDRVRELLRDRERLARLVALLNELTALLQAAAPAVTPGCVQFEALPLMSTFPVGSLFNEGAANMRVEPFEWANGIVTNNGFCQVQNGGRAGGPGQEMAVNNACLAFSFGGSPVSSLSLRAGEYGGNLNLHVNGVQWNFDNLSALPAATIGGVSVSSAMTPIAPPARGEIGMLNLSGPITSFAIGGQELWIDEVCYA